MNILNFDTKTFILHEKMNLESSWKLVLESEIEKEYFQSIMRFLDEQKAANKTVYPPSDQVFNAFNLTSYDNVKVVIIGQDPYHGPGQAMGLSFSVPQGIRVPPSLRNIYKELHTDIGSEMVTHGDLTSWANQGVLLLNAILTVEHKKAGSHKKIGWAQFTDSVIQKLSDEKSNLVFLLWGNFAKKKAELIDETKHCILKAAHPSPLARGAFFGSHPFSQTNAYLESVQKTPINWTLECQQPTLF